MIIDLAVEQLAFTCRHCGHRWNADYDVVSYEDGDGTTMQYFSVDGQTVPCPYAHASVLCPRCGQPTTYGHLVARRSAPVPPIEHTTRPEPPSPPVSPAVHAPTTPNVSGSVADWRPA